ncbi:hypothetical protein FC70_GL001477 [Paucilactobacillus oligofermentans DSM 15707 = LMG 22743]|uniref:Flavodoxin-like domain-containing protein n=1 Tax=Paucilactobacillus oligofermentans DSM 15707 = LMG 22743 TaxID=1423778 RepID=A0A0R1RCV9_9LACO|nr:flavodoxin [Paucilactobacillus oligofermentans]KRL54679.1 hypothetical protein FC70_GL001477 [Paucilactobacillus oligofermentans DSM 15707 = LMG 22743]CUS26411.1 Flavodoxin family protein [Paucilactobacillus oligofermentans DSM 15707 = LMG 22743]
MVVAVIYFSRYGKNIQAGRCQYINVGNTAMVAKKIEIILDVKGTEIVPINQYPDDYFETKVRAQQEFLNNERVKIKPVNFDETEHSIVLGFPNWWGTMPQAVKSFLMKYDLAGKNIYPFVTHEGSQFGQSLDDLKKLAPRSQVMSGLPIRGTRAYKSENAVINWLGNLDLK